MQNIKRYNELETLLNQLYVRVVIDNKGKTYAMVKEGARRNVFEIKHFFSK